MTNLAKRLMVAAAAVAAVAGVASAQTVKADVPFPFRVAGKAMPAGNYQIGRTDRQTTTAVFRLWNSDIQESVLVLSAGRHMAGPRSNADAKLLFKCVDGSCALAQLWTGSDNSGYDFNTPKTGHRDAAMIPIRATRISAE